MIGHREDWFPTSVWYFDHPDARALNGDLLTFLAKERAADPQGLRDRSSVRGWHSRDDLHLRPELQTFIQHLSRCVREVVAFQHWDRALVEPGLHACWAIVNGPGASNVVHNHPNAVLSGVYYLKTPANCGKIFFLDPRPAANVLMPPLTQFTPWTFRRVHYDPAPGRLLLFPSWVWHGVDPNESEEERVCLSFNLGLRWLNSTKA